jgi:hypothetical protein
LITASITTDPEAGRARSIQPACFAAAAAALLTAVVVGAAPASAVAHGTFALPGQDPFAAKLTITHIPRPDGTFLTAPARRP